MTLYFCFLSSVKMKVLRTDEMYHARAICHLKSNFKKV
jgi:hypothetical protein